MIHADNLHLFLKKKAFIVFYEEKPNFLMKAMTGGTVQIFPTWCIIYYVHRDTACINMAQTQCIT